MHGQQGVQNPNTEQRWQQVPNRGARWETGNEMLRVAEVNDKDA
jgi:hypothetical protein